MWEAYDLGNEDILWAGIPFLGGIGGRQEAPCGVISASAISIGLSYRCPMSDKQRAKKSRNAARELSGELITGFMDRFGAITCKDLIGLDMSDPAEYLKFQESGIWKEKCFKFIEFAIEKLYEFEKRGESHPFPML